MSDIILSIQNVSKQYQLGTFGTRSIGGDVNRWWHNVRGKEDPYLKIGAINDRTSKEKTDFVWALKVINFEVKRGEVLGIIGKNGAGKSTLLKLLSRITGPTTGAIRSAGRLASLLEVGTGFHPELTGLENIFLNGAILGMTKAEIKGKLEEIIDFSGCEMYINTPVKRYSSGMKVRLGFAVAAFLDPEILVVDEVLAVGDAEFQKKAIGKMKDVSQGQGRTVLFVSHNMASVRQLCTTGIMLTNGMISARGSIENVVDDYLRDTSLHVSSSIDLSHQKRSNQNASNLVRMSRVVFNNDAKITNGDPLDIVIEFEILKEVDDVVAGIAFTTLEGQRILTLDSDIVSNDSTHHLFKGRKGKCGIKMSLQRNDLQPGQYSIDIGLRTSIGTRYDQIIGCAIVEVAPGKNTSPIILASTTFGGLRVPVFSQAI